MIRLDVPGRGVLSLRHAVFDWNGTLARDGELLEAVVEPFRALKDRLVCHILTAATHGPPKSASAVLGVDPVIVPDGAAKAAFVSRLSGGVVAVGNGANDEAMFRTATLAIAVLGPEGLAVSSARAAHVIAARPEDAILLLLRPARLAATLRP